MCSAHATVRGFLSELVAKTGDHRDIIVDMEAGLEHLSRGTGRHVTRFLAVVEPYFRSLETMRRIAELAAELGVADVAAVANKVRTDADRQAIGDFCAAHGIRIEAEIPYDEGLGAAEREGAAPIDRQPPSPAVLTIQALATGLMTADSPL